MLNLHFLSWFFVISSMYLVFCLIGVNLCINNYSLAFELLTFHGNFIEILQKGFKDFSLKAGIEIGRKLIILLLGFD